MALSRKGIPLGLWLVPAVSGTSPEPICEGTARERERKKKDEQTEEERAAETKREIKDETEREGADVEGSRCFPYESA